jgi:hypothetical protein
LRVRSRPGHADAAHFGEPEFGGFHPVGYHFQRAAEDLNSQGGIGAA